MKTYSMRVFCLNAALFCVFALSGRAAYIKVVTEYRYPTSYTVTPITAVDPITGATRLVGGVVEPGDFETREVGSLMFVEATAVDLSLVRDSRSYRERQNAHGNTALMLAAAAGDARSVQSLLVRRADVDARNLYGSTALMGAAAGGFADVVRLLLRSGAFVNYVSGNGSTALMFAARNGHQDVVRQLLSVGAFVRMADTDGKTALRRAVEGGHVSIVQELVKAGADMDHRDRGGVSPLELAASHNDRSMLVLLTRLRAGQ